MAYHHGDLREALLAAAEALLRESGPAGLTLRACARHAGVSHAAPQHHFKDLADLLAEVAARGFDRLCERLRDALAQAGEDPRARFIAVARTYVAFARDDAALFRLMFRSDVLNGDNTALRSAARRSYAAMVDSVAAQRGGPAVLVEDLEQRIQDPGLMEDIVIAWTHIHGFAQLLIEGQLDVFMRDEALEPFVERMLVRAGSRLSWLLQQTADR